MSIAASSSGSISTFVMARGPDRARTGSGSERTGRDRGPGHPPAVVLSAEHLVRDQRRELARDCGVADHHLLALEHHLAIDGPGVVGRAGAAPAERVHLQHLDLVAQLDQPLRAREQPGLEIGQDADREHVDLQLVDDPGELVDLCGRVELRLVADQVVDPLAAGQVVDDEEPEAELRVDLDRRSGQAQPGGDRRLARPVLAGEESALPPGRGVRVVQLQGERRLAAVHRPGEVDELGHARNPATAQPGGDPLNPRGRAVFDRLSDTPCSNGR